MFRTLIFLISTLPAISMADTSTNLQSTAKVDPTCIIGTTDVDAGLLQDSNLITFRNYPGKLQMVNSKLSLRCTKNTIIDIKQNGGNNFDGNSNYLKTPNSKLMIPYSVYTDYITDYSKFSVLFPANNNHIHPSKSIVIRSLTEDTFDINFAFGLYFPTSTTRYFAPGVYKDTVNYQVGF